MSDIDRTITKIAARLRTIDPSPQPPLQTVYEDPKGAIALNDFPCIVIALSPSARHSWGLHGMDIGRHRYTLAIWVLIGQLNLAQLPELHSRILPWPSALAKALLSDITLGGAVDQIGKDGDVFFDYTVGPLKWGGGDYFGIAAELEVQEKPSIAIG
ncbi:MAG: hypothetical protein IPO81_09595 [Kouleothrix sp.]|nr:hypothetical protein [Kouleothrix sp.]